MTVRLLTEETPDTDSTFPGEPAEHSARWRVTRDLGGSLGFRLVKTRLRRSEPGRADVEEHRVEPERVLTLTGGGLDRLFPRHAHLH